MAEESSTEERVKRIKKTITKIKKEMPSLAIILKVYEKVFAERARLREELPLLMNVRISSPDPLRFSQGMTLMNEGIFPLSTDSMEKVTRPYDPGIGQGISENQAGTSETESGFKEKSTGFEKLHGKHAA